MIEFPAVFGHEGAQVSRTSHSKLATQYFCPSTPAALASLVQTGILHSVTRTLQSTITPCALQIGVRQPEPGTARACEVNISVIPRLPR